MIKLAWLEAVARQFNSMHIFWYIQFRSLLLVSKNWILPSNQTPRKRIETVQGMSLHCSPWLQKRFLYKPLDRNHSKYTLSYQYHIWWFSLLHQLSPQPQLWLPELDRQLHKVCKRYISPLQKHTLLSNPVFIVNIDINSNDYEG